MLNHQYAASLSGTKLVGTDNHSGADPFSVYDYAGDRRASRIRNGQLHLKGNSNVRHKRIHRRRLTSPMLALAFTSRRFFAGHESHQIDAVTADIHK